MTHSLTLCFDTQDAKNAGYTYSFVAHDLDSDYRHEETGEVDGDTLAEAVADLLASNATEAGETWGDVLDGCDPTETSAGALIWRW